MDKRFTLFMLLAVAIVIANQLIYALFFAPPPQPPKAKVVKEPAVAAQEDQQGQQEPAAANDLAAPSLADRPAVEPKAAVDVAAVAETQPNQPPRWVSIGSADPASRYRMLVIFTNRGAAVERLELNSPRYRDLEDRSGYLGVLAATDAPNRGGALVNLVPAGTPAERAGVKVEDVITAIDSRPINTAADLHAALASTEPRQTIQLAVERAGAVEALTAQLQRQPLAVIRPEWKNRAVEVGSDAQHDRFSFLVTLQQFDDQVMNSGSDGELAGVSLLDATWEIVSADAENIHFRAVLPKLEVQIDKKFKLARVPEAEHDDPDSPSYHLNLSVSLSNLGQRMHRVAYRLDGPTGLPIEGYWYAMKVSRTWSGAGLRDIIGRFQGGVAEQVTPAQLAQADFKKNWADSPLDFIAVDAQYFTAAILPQKSKPNEVWFASVQPVRVGAIPEDKARVGLTNVSCRLDSIVLDLPAGGAPVDHEMTVFAGPKRPGLLSAYGPPNATLAELVYYGWFGIVARPMLAILHFFYSIVGNYGIAIILLTVLVRSCMFPVSRKQAAGAQKMAELQPEIKKINEKFKNEPDKRTRAQQELFRQHNYNPLGGCMLAFAQIPIFVGLYNSLRVDVELRQSPLISESIRWASNLVAPDMLWNWTGVMPEFITHGTGIFGLGPYLNILPLATVALMIASQKAVMPPPTDEQTAMQQKMMQYMLVIMGLFFFKVASGLCVYFLATSVWSIAERKLLPKKAPAGGSTAANGARTQTSGGGGGAATAKKRQRG